MDNNAIEIYESIDRGAKFYFSHSDKNITTGILVLQPGAALPKHNRPHAIENLTQISGKCLMVLLDEKNHRTDIKLDTDERICMYKGQWHIHTNPYTAISITLFKTEGDIMEIMKKIRNTNTKIVNHRPKDMSIRYR